LPFSPFQKPPLGARINRDHPLSRGLVGCWLFNEGSGNLISDLSGNNNTGTLINISPQTNASGWVPGGRGAAIQFDGTNDYLDLGNNPSLESPLPVTLSVWVCAKDLSTWYNPIATDAQTTYSGLMLEINTDGTIGFQFGDGTGGGSTDRRSKASVGAISVGKWFHVVGVCRGADDMDIYINGIDAGGTYSGTGGAVAYTANSAKIGSNAWGDGYYTGLVDDVRIYNRALSPREVLSLYSAPYEMFEEELPLELQVSAGGTTHECAGTSAGTSMAAGVLAVTMALAGSAAGVSAGTGLLAVTHPMVSVSASASTATGTLTQTQSLAGSAASASAATAGLTQSVGLGGSSSCQSTLTATLNAYLAQYGVCVGTSAATAGLGLDLGVIGSSAGTSSATAGITVDFGLVGSSAGASTAVGDLLTGTTHECAGSGAGVSAASADVSLTLPLIGSSAGTSAASAELLASLSRRGYQRPLRRHLLILR
jgi:hypothetical protein